MGRCVIWNGMEWLIRYDSDYDEEEEEEEQDEDDYEMENYIEVVKSCLW